MNHVARLEVPARPEYVAVLRLVVGAASASQDWLRDERLDDLKLAISEACIALVTADAQTIRMETTVSSSQIEVELSSRGVSTVAAIPDSALAPDPFTTNPGFEFGTPLVAMLVDKVETSRESDSVKLIVLREPEIAKEP